MVLEPGGLHNQLVTGTSTGELKFVDFRVVDSSGQMGVWKTVEAHTKGAMTAMAAHPYSPLLATATATQVHGHERQAAPQTWNVAWSHAKLTLLDISMALLMIAPSHDGCA